MSLFVRPALNTTPRAPKKSAADKQRDRQRASDLVAAALAHAEAVKAAVLAEVEAFRARVGHLPSVGQLQSIILATEDQMGKMHGGGGALFRCAKVEMPDIRRNTIRSIFAAVVWTTAT
jgi:hypothetical protein